MSARAQPRPTPDLGLLAVTIVLVVVGIVFVYSASFVMAQTVFKDATMFVSRQVVWMILGLVGMFAAASIDYHRLEEISVPFMVVVLVCMLAVFIPGLGVEIDGAQRWLKLPPPLPPIQPSEFAKVGLIILLAALSSKKAKGHELTYVLGFFGWLAMTLVPILLQPDTGTAFVVAFTAGCIFFVAGANLIYVLGLATFGVGGFYYFLGTAGYRASRLKAFMNPWADSQDTGYHTVQMLIALGSGGLTGLGLGASRQKFYYVPNAHTDAIFAIIGEELGFVGAAGVVILFGLFAWRGFRIAFKAPDTFGRLLATGVTCSILAQAATNIAVVTNTIPNTGITLPFISSGGSSLLVCMIGTGILMGVSRHEGLRAPQAQKNESVVKVLQRKPLRQPRLAASSSAITTKRRTPTSKRY